LYFSNRYGDSIGTLNVYLFNGSYTYLWSLSGNRGDNWYEGQVSYVSLIPHQIIVEGIAGNDFLVRINLSVLCLFRFEILFYLGRYFN
jgi:hypothetical protein